MSVRARSAARPPVQRGVASARRRFERRAAQARRRPRLLALGGVVLLLLVGSTVWLGWYSSILTAQVVEVRGVPKAQEQVVREVADVVLGGPLLRVDTESVIRRLEADRRWTDVSVSRSLPHTVVVTVTARKPALAVRTPSGQIDLLDPDGFAFRTVKAAPGDVPLVTASGGSVGPAGVSAALQALSALKASLRADVTGVSVSSADQVTLTLAHRGATRTVVWGGPGDAALKARVVEILLSQPGSTIDVSVPDSPVTR